MTHLSDNCPWISQLHSDLPTLIRRGDHFCIWGLPLVGTSTYLRNFIEKPPENVALAYFDTHNLTEQSAENFLKLSIHTLQECCPDVDISEDNGDSLSTAKKLISHITKEKQLCVIVDSLNDLTFLDKVALRTFQGLGKKFSGKLIFGFVSTRPLHEDPHYRNFPGFADFATHREFIAKPLEGKGLSQLTDKIDEYSTVEFDQTQIDTIISLSGGIIGLLKSIIRAIESQDEISLEPEDILEDTPTRTRIEFILSSFSKEEVEMLQTIKSSGKMPPILTKYVAESGILEGTTIRSSLIDRFLENGALALKSAVRETKNDPTAHTHLHVDTKTGEIHIDGNRSKDILSDSELKIVKFMISKNEGLSTREEIAGQLWGDESAEKYSDWAIDKAISRIRKKLNDSKSPHRHLITVKGRGFIFHLD